MRCPDLPRIYVGQGLFCGSWNLGRPFALRSIRVDERSRGRIGIDGIVDKQTKRTLLTILMYAGVGVFLFPYFTGKASTAPVLMILGALISVVCGLARCYHTEEK